MDENWKELGKKMTVEEKEPLQIMFAQLELLAEKSKEARTTHELAEITNAMCHIMQVLYGLS